MSHTDLPKPVLITMKMPIRNYPFLEVGKTYMVPYEYAKGLLEHDFAEIEKIRTDEYKIFGRNSFEKKNTEKKKDDEVLKSSLYIDGQFMYEQVKEGTRSSFLRYSFADGSLEHCEVIPGEKPIFPIDDEEVAAGHIKLPSGIEEYGTEKKLIEEIERHVERYLDVPADYRHYAVLNILKSWVYERYRSLNYLRVQGEPGTGKSRFLDVIGGLHYKPIATSGASTVSPIFRLIHKWGCTLVMDEADLKISDETNDLIKIINQGFEKDRPVIRCNPDNKTQVEFFNVYCPKVLSTRRQFEDVATESRCMTQIMSATSRKDIISSLNDAFQAEQQSLRNKLLLWRFRNFNRINPDIGETLDWAGIEPRLKQVNIGFVSLIHNDSEYIKVFLERIKAAQMQLINERSETVEGHIIGAISRLMVEGHALTAKAIIAGAELTDTHGNLWKPRRIASFMKTLGFHGTKLLRSEMGVEKVYQFSNQILSQLFTKYLTPDELSDFNVQASKITQNVKHPYFSFFCNHVTVVTIVTEQGKNLDRSKALSENAKYAENVTNTPPHQYNGYNSYTVTEKLNKLKEKGEIMETEPGVYRLVK